MLRGIEIARHLGMFAVGLTGASGGELCGLVDECICVPSSVTPQIQEAHILIGHIWCEIVERELFGSIQSTADEG